MADFIAELTPVVEEHLDFGPIPNKEMVIRHGLSPESWNIFVDWSTNNRGCGAGLVVISPIRTRTEVALRRGIKTSNNEAEYEALLAGLKVAQEQGATQFCIYSHSMLVVNQVKEDYQVKGTRLAKYKTQVKDLLMTFIGWEIRQIP